MMWRHNNKRMQCVEPCSRKYCSDRSCVRLWFMSYCMLERDGLKTAFKKVLEDKSSWISTIYLLSFWKVYSQTFYSEWHTERDVHKHKSHQKTSLPNCQLPICPSYQSPCLASLLLRQWWGRWSDKWKMKRMHLVKDAGSLWALLPTSNFINQCYCPDKSHPLCVCVCVWKCQRETDCVCACMLFSTVPAMCTYIFEIHICLKCNFQNYTQFSYKPQQSKQWWSLQPPCPWWLWRSLDRKFSLSSKWLDGPSSAVGIGGTM